MQAHRTRRQLEVELADYAVRLHARGWVANHDGNASVRLPNVGPERFLCTPTAMSKACIERDMLLVVDATGKRISGRFKPFSEIDLHLCAFRNRPDVRAVLHAHPPTATGMAVAGVPILSTMLPESVVSLGESIPLVPYAAPKTPECTLNLLGPLKRADAFVLERHGVLTVGPDLETAYLRMELVEHLARIQLAARQTGMPVRTLPPDDIAALLQARVKAGLGPPA